MGMEEEVKCRLSFHAAQKRVLQEGGPEFCCVLDFSVLFLGR